MRDLFCTIAHEADGQLAFLRGDSTESHSGQSSGRGLTRQSSGTRALG